MSKEPIHFYLRSDAQGYLTGEALCGHLSTANETAELLSQGTGARPRCTLCLAALDLRMRPLERRNA